MGEDVENENAVTSVVDTRDRSIVVSVNIEDSPSVSNIGAKSLLTSANEPQAARLVMRYQFISGTSASWCRSASLRIAGVLMILML